MKKALLLVVAVLLVAGSLFAATSTKFSSYGSIFKKGEFTLTGKVYEINASGNRVGNGSPITVAMHAGEYYMEASEGGQTAKMILKQDGKLYIIDDGEKMIMILPGDDSDSDLIQMPSTYDFTTSGNGKFDGKSLSYETVKEDGTDTIYWYNGSSLYAIQTKDYSSNSAIIIDSITQSASASLFTIPTGSQTMDMSDLGSWGDSWGSSDYNWDSYDSTDWSELENLDWSSLFGDLDWSYDPDPHYYAFAIMMGLNNTQARSFADAMSALSEIEWDMLNDYYDSDADRYNLNGTPLTDAAYISNSTVTQINNLLKKFK